MVCPDAADEAEGRRLAQEEERARRLAFLTMRDNSDGTTDGRFRLPTLHAQVLRKALEALTSPRRLDLQDYDGVTSDRVKVGTFKRAKGLEFKFVLIPVMRPGPLGQWSGESDDSYPMVSAPNGRGASCMSA